MAYTTVQDDIYPSIEKIRGEKECKDAHYNVWLNTEHFDEVKLDPYLVAKVWDITDPCLFHILKTIARAGKKEGNTLGREYESILLTINRAVNIKEDHGL